VLQDIIQLVQQLLCAKDVLHALVQYQTVHHAQVDQPYPPHIHVQTEQIQTPQREAASSSQVWLSSALSYIISSELSDCLNIDIYKL
jgi:apolipoprotein N-acyltransferase